MNLMAMQIEENRRNVKMTVLRREGGTWQSWEIGNLVNNLMTEISHHPQHPEHLVVFGHYSKERALKAHGGGLAFTATQITGIQSKELPFMPGFI